MPLRVSAIFSLAISIFLFLPVGTAWAETEDEDESAGKSSESDAEPEDESQSIPKRFQFEGSVYTLFSMQNDNETASDFGFSIERARMEFNWQVSRHIKSVVEAALDDLTAEGTPDDLLRDAYIRYAPFPELQFTAGQFKKPFSLFELKSRGKMPIIRRGVTNDYLIRDLGYGGRDIGFQIGGTFQMPLKIRYAAGIFNGNGANQIESDGNGAKDFAGRIELMTKKRFRAGLNFSWKNFDQTSPGNESKPTSAWMTGGDVQVRLSGLYLMAEGMYGINHASDGHPRAAGMHGLVTWKFRLPRRQMFLAPVVRIDWLWPVFSENQKSSVRVATLGVHWQIEKHLRLMLEYETTRSSQDAGGTWPDSDCFLVQLALDL